MPHESLIRRLLRRVGAAVIPLPDKRGAPGRSDRSDPPDDNDDPLNAHFRALRDASPDGFMAFRSIRDASGQIVDFEWTYTNASAAKIVQRRPDELIGKRLLDVMPGNKREGLFDQYVRVVETARPFTRELQYDHDGITIYVRLTATPAGDGFAVAFTDLSDLRRVEEALRQRTTFLRAIAESTQDVNFAKDLHGRLTFANPATLALIGKSESDVLGRTDMELLQDKDAARRVMENDRRIMERGETEELEEIVPLPDGTDRIWLSRKVPYRDEDGKVAGLLGISRDITVRRQTELRVLESERRFRSVVESVPGHIWTAQADGSIDFSGPWMSNYTGVAPDRLHGDAWHEVVHPADLPRTVEAWTRSLRTGETYSVEFRIRSRNGDYRWMASRAVPQRDEQGRIIRWFGYTGDIHDQRLKDDALRDSAERLQLTAAAAGMGFWTIDLQSRTVMLDETCARLIELPAGVAIPNSTVRERICAQDYPQVRAAIDDALGGNRYAVEFRINLRDGTQRWLGALGNVIRENDRQVRLVGVNWDITHRKRAEAEREALLDAERRARTEAERASRLKDDFLATLSHELRTPLNAIIGWAEILASPGAIGEPDTLRSGVDAILRNARSQTELVNDLLDMSSIINGKLRLDLRTLDLRPLVLAAIDTVRPAADARQVRIETDLIEAVGDIRGDPHRIQQVVWNLMTNAVKFTPAGGTVRVTLRNIDPVVRLSVCDTGQGIAPDFLPHVFDRFRQADASTRRRHGGLGLGLAIVRELVELHGGTVSAASDGAGRGATFCVDLPRLAAPVEAHATPQADPIAPATRSELVRRHRGKVLIGTTVLLVDDEPDALAVVQRTLVEHGARVLLASTAAEAYNLLVERRPDLLISDIGMPGEDGYDLIRRVRALPAGEGGQTPAIALSAFARADDVRRSLQSGYRAHLTKPVPIADLIDQILGLTTGDASPRHVD
ncbi:MAG TPA: PAS domain-containing protein, partial [Tepidisphaeraceae bacterium]|nr:PAS domain-containing protein [Tepidisphaeraceae bacterium]